MADVWTHGTWTVKPGREDEFIAALRALTQEVSAELGAEPPTFLRDREQPNVFMTFSPWESDAEIERFRAFLFPRLGPLRELLESFEPNTLDPVALR
jgi:quinol monooxygenase YgiN